MDQVYQNALDKVGCIICDIEEDDVDWNEAAARLKAVHYDLYTRRSELFGIGTISMVNGARGQLNRAIDAIEDYLAEEGKLATRLKDLVVSIRNDAPTPSKEQHTHP